MRQMGERHGNTVYRTVFLVFYNVSLYYNEVNINGL